VVSYRVRARVAAPKYEQRYEAAPAKPRAIADAVKGKRDIYFDGESAVASTVYERDGLDVGVTIAGPAVVEQFDATTVVPPGWSGRVDGHRNLLLTKGAA
jgi:N-methylhydantoinase A/oxoprolinase/acetone carboxylase beta subunit